MRDTQHFFTIVIAHQQSNQNLEKIQTQNQLLWKRETITTTCRQRSPASFDSI